MNINLVAENKREYYEKFLSLLSTLSPPTKQLSPLEIKVLSHFMEMYKEHSFYPFSPKARKMVIRALGVEHSTQNMSIKICRLIDKNYLIRDEDNFIDYSPILKEIINSSQLNVSLSYRPPDKKDGQSA